MLTESSHCQSDLSLVLDGKGMKKQGSPHTMEVKGLSASASQVRGQENSLHRYKNLTQLS